jgi:lipoprotein-anchoring transpeptidase ErfK/SrfK
MSSILSRRDFLKLTGAAVLGVACAGLPRIPARAHAYPVQGRVLATRLNIRAAPSFNGRKVTSAKRDDVLEIEGEVYGGQPGDTNRLWYRLANGNYAYSGWIQTVWARRNPIITKIPETGVLGEITVPFADSVYSVNSNPYRGVRLYYESTHWVTALITDKRDGSFWYQAYDAATYTHYHIRPEGVHLFSPEEIAPLSANIPENDKRIEVHLDRQILMAYEGDVPVHAARVATGVKNYETPSGWFRTFHKRPTYHMYGGADEFSVFDLPGVPWDTYITENGVALHGTYWHNDFGVPHSHGCINMSIADARWIYRWTTPYVPAEEKMVLQPGSGTRLLVIA